MEIAADALNPAGELRFSLSGRTLTFRGEIGPEFFNQLKQYDFTLLEIESVGGLLAPAEAAGRYLRRMNKDVRVKDTCLSACVLVLAGGVHRDASNDSKVGVHRFSSPLQSEFDLEIGQQKSSELIRFLEEMGVSSDLFHAMAAVPSDEMRYLPRSDMEKWRLLTGPRQSQPPVRSDPLPPAAPSNPIVSFDLREDLDLPGGDFAVMKDVTIDSCASSCRTQSQCTAYTYNAPVRWCFLKDRVGTPMAFKGATTGFKTQSLVTQPRLTASP
ncbi:MAG TPA: PAN domain-containing protein [Microvirga sp.]|jgi:hypothetical protein|nr:PAN domain-containing protein [Microvirga sp.]